MHPASQPASSSRQLAEDEALARALAAEEDEALARALQASLNTEQGGSSNQGSSQQSRRQVGRSSTLVHYIRSFYLL